MPQITFSVLALAALAAGDAGRAAPRALAPALVLESDAGARVSLCAEKAGRIATAVVVLDEGCEVSRRYAPVVGDLAREYQEQGIDFVVIDATPGVDAKTAQAFARKHAIDARVLLDPLQAGARLLGVTHAATALLYVGAMVESYRGAIDDRFTLAQRRDHASHDWLVEAMEAALERRAPETAATEAPGRELAAAGAAGKLTFNADVAPILYRNCVECHRPGQIGPMALLDYDDAKGWAPMIAEVVSNGRMPPWHADARFGHFQNERRLTETERAVLCDWATGGAAEGDAKAPAPPQFDDGGWAIGKPDLVIELPKDEAIPADGVVDYRYVLVDPKLTEDHWVQAVEIRPTATSATHHVLALYIPPGHGPIEQLSGLRDGTLVGAGYFGVQVPGCRPNVYPPGTGKHLEKGARFLCQLHYTPTGKAMTDRTRIGFVFCKEKPAREVKTRGIFSVDLRIPPNDPAATFTANYVFERPIELLSMFPHMHTRGKAFRFERVTGPRDDPKATILLDVPKYDFNWQNFYRPDPPVRFAKGDAMRITAVYDNSKENPFNPDASKWVTWGDQTFEEMMIGYIDYLEEK
jgi:mono/diheme cytochrome c family protein